MTSQLTDLLHQYGPKAITLVVIVALGKVVLDLLSGRD